MTVIPVSGGRTDRQINLLKDFQSEVICCTPSYAQTIAFELERKGIPLSDLNLKYAVLGAEPWTDAIRQDIESSLGVKASNIYGLSEIMGPGVSQEAVEEQSTGCYIWEDHFFPEVVDKDTGEPLPYGKEGVLVLTTLTKEAMPFVRYWTGDICSIYYDESQSRSHIKMSRLKGRADDMLIIRGVNLFHTQVEDVLKDYQELAPNYQLEVTKDGLMDRVEVKVETSRGFQNGLGFQTGFENHHIEKTEDLTNLQKQLNKNIKTMTGLSMKISLKSYGKIPKSKGGKLQRIIDLRE
jgi:phenylacetate-CoA ligase